jgi:hypothetical protein
MHIVKVNSSERTAVDGDLKRGGFCVSVSLNR